MTLLRLELSFSRLESLHVAGSFSSVSSKQIVKELLENLPDETTLLEIAHEIEFLDGLRSGLEEADRGEFISADKLRAQITGWANSK